MWVFERCAVEVYQSVMFFGGRELLLHETEGRIGREEGRGEEG